MKDNLKRLVFVIFVWFLSFLSAHLAVLFVRNKVPTYSVNDAQSVVLAWSALFTGMSLYFKSKKWKEIVLAVLFYILCLLPTIGIYFGLLYFLRFYNKKRQRVFRRLYMEIN